MEDESWMCDLAFLVVITTHQNDLNTKLQQSAQFVNDIYGHIKIQVKTLETTHTERETKTTFKFWETL